MKTRVRAMAVVLVLLLLGCTANALATAITFTDRASWQSAVDALSYNSTNIGFENATRAYVPLSHTVTIASDGVTIVDNSLYSTDVYNSGGGNFILDFVFSIPVLITMPNNVYAFGLDYGSTGGGSWEDYQCGLDNVNLSTGETLGSFNGTCPGYLKLLSGAPIIGNFAGVISDTPISSMNAFIYSQEANPAIDNFTFAQAQPVPEPSSILLLVSGLLGLVGYEWHKKKS